MLNLNINMGPQQMMQGYGAYPGSFGMGNQNMMMSGFGMMMNMMMGVMMQFMQMMMIGLMKKKRLS